MNTKKHTETPADKAARRVAETMEEVYRTQDRDEFIVDILTELMHWSEDDEYFESALRSARSLYKDEKPPAV